MTEENSKIGNGLGVTHRTWSEAVDAVRTGISSMVPTHVITLTPEMCLRASKDSNFASIVKNAAMVVADGVGVVWGEGKLTGCRPEKIPGIELALKAVGETDKINGSLFLLGSEKSVVEAAADEIRAKYPRISDIRHHDGYFDRDDEKSVAEEIASFNPNLLLVGMGSPRQEEFISGNLLLLRCGLAIGVGGSFDVISGSVKRAPQFFRSTGTEWLYRTLSQPGERIKRIPELIGFVQMVLNKR